MARTTDSSKTKGATASTPATPAAPAPAAEVATGVGAEVGAGAGALAAAEGGPAAEGAGKSGAAKAGAAVHHRQVKVGKVVSNKMDKTVIVTVENTTTHRLYHRYMKRTSKFAAHDAENRCQIGDVVEIVSSRPMSRTKRWRVREVLKRAQ
jgi:small subunit ribosomal protein S17